MINRFSVFVKDYREPLACGLVFFTVATAIADYLLGIPKETVNLGKDLWNEAKTWTTS